MEKSIEEKEDMFEQVMKHIIDSYKDVPPEAGLKISKSFLENVVNKSLDEEYVIDNNEELSKTYAHISSAYGFDSFYDLYQFSVATEELEELQKGGQKDLSRLKKVKRNVMRNGKQTTMTFYEDPSAGGQKEKKDKAKPGEEEEIPEPIKASELQGNVVGDIQKPIPIKDLKLLKKLHTGLQGSQEEFDANCQSYLVLKDENEEAKAIIGFKLQGEYIELVMADSDALTTNLESRAFYELIKLALASQLGAMFTPLSKLHLSLAEAHEFKLKGTVATVEYKKLVKLYGKMD